MVLGCPARIPEDGTGTIGRPDALVSYKRIDGSRPSRTRTEPESANPPVSASSTPVRPPARHWRVPFSCDRQQESRLAAIWEQPSAQNQTEDSPGKTLTHPTCWIPPPAMRGAVRGKSRSDEARDIASPISSLAGLVPWAFSRRTTIRGHPRLGAGKQRRGYAEQVRARRLKIVGCESQATSAHDA